MTREGENLETKNNKKDERILKWALEKTSQQQSETGKGRDYYFKHRHREDEKAAKMQKED